MSDETDVFTDKQREELKELLSSSQEDKSKGPDAGGDAGTDEREAKVAELEKELLKNQKKTYEIERKQALSELSQLDSDIGEKYKKANLSVIQQAYDLLKEIKPKFDVDIKQKKEETERPGHYYDRIKGKMV